MGGFVLKKGAPEKVLGESKNIRDAGSGTGVHVPILPHHLTNEGASKWNSLQS